MTVKELEDVLKTFSEQGWGDKKVFAKGTGPIDLVGLTKDGVAFYVDDETEEEE